MAPQSVSSIMLVKEAREGPQRKIASSLLQYVLPDDTPNAASPFANKKSSYNSNHHGILVEIVCTTKADDAVREALTSAGARITNCYDYLCSARVFPRDLESVAALDQVNFIHQSMPVTHGRSARHSRS